MDGRKSVVVKTSKNPEVKKVKHDPGDLKQEIRNEHRPVSSGSNNNNSTRRVMQQKQIDSRRERFQKQTNAIFNASQVQKLGYLTSTATSQLRKDFSEIEESSRRRSLEKQQQQQQPASRMKKEYGKKKNPNILDKAAAENKNREKVITEEKDQVENEVMSTQETSLEVAAAATDSVSELTLELSKLVDSISETSDNNNNNNCDRRIKKLKSEPNLSKKEKIDHKNEESSRLRSKSRMTVTTIRRRERESDSRVKLPEGVKAVLDDDDEADRHRRMHLVKCRYQHIIKSELVDFVAPADDDDLLPNHSERSPEFISTLIGLVEKDKEIADMAVNLVSQMDLMEKAEIGYWGRKGGPVSGLNVEEDDFKEIWENHKKSRKEIITHLEQERNQLFKDGPLLLTTDNIVTTNNISQHSLNDQIDDDETIESKIEKEVNQELEKELLENFMGESMSKMRHNNSDQSLLKEGQNNKNHDDHDDDDKAKEIQRVLDKILRRLGCEPSSSLLSTNKVPADSLKIIQDKMKSLKKELEHLKSLP